MKDRPLILALACLLLAACAPTAPVVRDGPTVAGAERLEARGEYAAAGEAWVELAGEQPERFAEFGLQAMEAWLRAGELGRAGDLAGRIDPADLDPADRIRLDLARAELALARGDLGLARRLLELEPAAIPDPLMPRFERLGRRLIERRDAPAAAAVQALLEAMDEGRFTPELAQAGLIELPVQALEDLTVRHAGDPRLEPWLELGLAGRRFLLDPERLDAALAAWERDYPRTGYSAEQARAWLEAFRDTVAWPQQIAVLLPGSGGLVRPGEVLREGLMAGWFDLPPENRPQLRFHYLEDEPDSAVSAWFQAREDGADFLIGPLDRRQVDALLGLADPGLPILLLNQPETHPGPDDALPLAVLALPPEEEAELAAVRALVEGHERALVLGQDTAWGHRVADGFAEPFALGGGRIVERASYPSGESDHSRLLERLLGHDRSAERIRALGSLLGVEIEAVSQRRTDIELIFLAARNADARQLRPQLRFFDAGDLPIYATSHIWAGSGTGADLEGIELPASPWLVDGTGPGELRRLAEQRFDGLGNPVLTQLHALGRDALALAPWMDWMKSDRNFYLAGNTGRLRLADGRMFERDLPWVRIERDRLVPVR